MITVVILQVVFSNRDETVPTPKILIARALQQTDDLVVVFDYLDSLGIPSRRVVSPYRIFGDEAFLGLCFTREEPRRFQLSRIRNLKIDLAMNYVMPVTQEEIMNRFSGLGAPLGISAVSTMNATQVA
jgi:predicted DNA-binding transcriptional regulator YafY